MISKVLENSYVIDFVNVDYDSKFIEQRLLSELERVLRDIEIPETLKEWTLQFSIIYNNVKNLGIARKTKSVKSLKLKEIIIHLPIPTKEKVSWGVNKNQLIREIQFDNRYVDEINVDFQKYDNRTDYIIENIESAIILSLELGITINGERIKIKK